MQFLYIRKVNILIQIKLLMYFKYDTSRKQTRYVYNFHELIPSLKLKLSKQ